MVSTAPGLLEEVRRASWRKGVQSRLWEGRCVLGYEESQGLPGP